MLIHLIASSTELNETVDALRKITEYVKSKGHSMTLDWVDAAYRQMQHGEPMKEDAWQKIVKDNFEAIAKSDVVIADVSYDSTALGYQIAMAVQQKKPTLLLVRENVKVPPFTWNIPSDFLSKVEYTDTDVLKKIAPFLENNDISIKDMRFNFFIDRPIYNYLRWAALRTGKTKAEILRNLVQQEIDRRDS